MDDLSISFDLALHAVLADGRLVEGAYDFSGTTLALRQVGLEERDNSGQFLPTPGSWWTDIGFTDGRVWIGKPLYFDAVVSLTAPDSAPFVRMASQYRDLPPWIVKALSVADVRGQGRVTLAADSVRLRQLTLTGGAFELQLRLLRQRLHTEGALLASYGPLSLGIGFDGSSQELHVVGARDWFGTPDGDEPSAPVLQGDGRQLRRDERSKRVKGR